MTSLRELRANQLLSIRELARRASVAPSTIYLIESGRTIASQRVARLVSEVLGVDPSDVEEFHRRIEIMKVRHTRSPGTETGQDTE